MGKKVIKNNIGNSLCFASAEDLFTDREEPRKAFWNVYDSLGSGEFDILSYYGIGGVGKSTLLRKLQKEIEEKITGGQIDFVYYSFECEPTKTEFLYSLSRKMMLRNKGLSFPVFDTAIEKIAEDGKLNISELEETGKKIIAVDSAKLAVNVAFDFIPYGETMIKAVEGIATISSKIKKEISKNNTENKNIINDILYHDGKYANEKLQEYFVKDAFDTFEKRKKPFVVFLDGYEHYVNRVRDGERAGITDYWMYGDNGLIYLPNTIWVIAGRNDLEWPSDILSPNNCHRIGSLSEEDTVQYFNKAGIVEETLVKALYHLSEGTPAFLDLCVETYYKIKEQKNPQIEDFGQNTERLAQRYLENMDASKQAIIRMLSCFPNIWNEEMAFEVAKRLGYSNVKIIIDDLLPLSIFERFPNGIKLNDTVRRVICKNTKNINEINRVICLYLKEKILNAVNDNNIQTIIVDFCGYLKTELSAIVTEEEIPGMLVIVNDAFDFKGEFNKKYYILTTLEEYCINHNFSPEVIVRCKNDIITFFAKNDDYEKLYELAEKTYNYELKQFGEKHKETLITIANIAVYYYHNKEYDEAIKLGEKYYPIFCEVYGEKDNNSLYFLHNLSYSYSKIGRQEEAINTLKKICLIYSEKETIDNLYLDLLKTLARIMSENGNNEEAYDLFVKCYNLSCESFGETHMDSIHALSQIGIILERQEKYEEAGAIYEKVYRFYNDCFGEKHSKTLKYLWNSAKMCIKLERYETAKEKLQILSHDCYEKYGYSNIKTIQVLNGLGKCLYELKEFDKAIENDKKCLEYSRQVVGEKDYRTLRCIWRLAISLSEVERFDEALSFYQECYDSHLNLYGDTHSLTIDALENLIDAYRDVGNNEKADELKYKLHK